MRDGTGYVDRAAEERDSLDLLDRARAVAETRVLVVAGDSAPLAAHDRIAWLAPTDAPAGAEWAFLGRDTEGSALLLAALPRADLAHASSAHEWGSLREVAADLTPVDADALVTGVSLARWLLDASFCPACGARCVLRNSGWSRHCPSCGREHFPRTDPAVIVAITSSADPDALLLGSNALWGSDRYSCFAGFAEAGESLESAVHREVREESGVDVTDVRYFSSQAWPYPRSLMLGFFATAVDDATARPDGEEIADVRWFSRTEIGSALRGESTVRLPGPASIAHRLISTWFEADA